MEWMSDFLHLVFVAFVSLFPPVNPIGSALIVDPFFHGTHPGERRFYAKKIALYSFGICIVATLLGSWIFKLFGISLPVVQLAGGILICQMGWKLLSTGIGDKGSDGVSSPSDTKKNIESILFYPIAFPITTGAGTISVLLTLSAHGHRADYVEYFANLAAVFAAITLMCLSVYFCYAYTPALLKRVGERGERIINSLSAYLVFCVGIQIGFAGLKQLL